MAKRFLGTPSAPRFRTPNLSYPPKRVVSTSHCVGAMRGAQGFCAVDPRKFPLGWPLSRGGPFGWLSTKTERVSIACVSAALEADAARGRWAHGVGAHD